MTIKEKRKFPRLNLRIDDGYFGNFKLTNDETMVAPIVNISAGGLNMAIPVNAKEIVKEGDQLLMSSIAGGTYLAFLSDVISEVCWVKSLGTPGYVSVGCKFINLTDELREQLSRFVDSERISRGQYG